MFIVPNDATHATVARITFQDGGEPEESVLHFGSFEACDKVARSLPGLAYNGDRPVSGATVSVFPLHPICPKCQCRHAGDDACAALSAASDREGER